MNWASPKIPSPKWKPRKSHRISNANICEFIISPFIIIFMLFLSDLSHNRHHLVIRSRETLRIDWLHRLLHLLTAVFIAIDNVAKTFLDTFVACFRYRWCAIKEPKSSRFYAFFVVVMLSSFAVVENMRMKIEKEIRKIAFTLFSRRQIPFRSKHYTKATTNNNKFVIFLQQIWTK